MDMQETGAEFVPDEWAEIKNRLTTAVLILSSCEEKLRILEARHGELSSKLSAALTKSVAMESGLRTALYKLAHGISALHDINEADLTREAIGISSLNLVIKEARDKIDEITRAASESGAV